MIRRLSVAVSTLCLLLTAAAVEAAYSPATTNGWFITSGRVAGAGGALFRTDIWLFNPSNGTQVTVTLIFHRSVSSGQAAPAPITSSAITLAPRETRFFADVTLATVPAGDGAVGSLEWESSGPVMGAGRIYTFTPTGTFGFFLPAIPISESIGPKQSVNDAANVLQIYGVNSGDPNFRTNLDLTNTSNITLNVEVRVIDPVTAQVYGGTQSFSIAAGSLLRLGPILSTSGTPIKDGIRITAAIREGTVVPAGGLLAAAYTLDNRTQDAFAFVGQRQSSSP